MKSWVTFTISFYKFIQEYIMNNKNNNNNKYPKIKGKILFFKLSILTYGIILIEMDFYHNSMHCLYYSHS